MKCPELGSMNHRHFCGGKTDHFASEFKQFFPVIWGVQSSPVMRLLMILMILTLELIVCKFVDI